MRTDVLVGWDIGGAHVKAAVFARASDGTASLVDARQWPCPLWQGLDHLRAALAQARARWPQLARAQHAVTMSGEMVDLFPDREAGVLALGEVLGASLDGSLAFWAGARGWCGAAELRTRWAEVASANWSATAVLAASCLARGVATRASAHAGHETGAVLVDVGSTTTDVIALRAGRMAAQGQGDAERLASGELVYQGVVRTPLCALAPRIEHGGRLVNVMNEFFATTADVYRLLGELDPANDQQPAADGAAKDAVATRRRLARMIGLDARDEGDAPWQTLARAWRAAQLTTLAQNLERVAAHAGLGPEAGLVSAGCGDFLVEALAQATGRPCLRFESLVLGESAAMPQDLRRWVQVGSPAVAVALLHAQAEPGVDVVLAQRRDARARPEPA